LSGSEVNDRQILDEALALLSEKPVSNAKQHTSTAYTVFQKEENTRGIARSKNVGWTRMASTRSV